MITDLIVRAILSAVSAVFTLIPDFTPPEITLPSIIGGWTNEFGRILALDYLIALVLISLAIAAFVLLMDLALFVYHQFWGAS